jgi:hypothetical protein
MNGFEHQRADLVGRQLLRLVALGGVDAQHLQQHRHEDVDEPHHRREQPEQRPEHIGQGQRDALRVRRADDLGRDLGKNEDQESHRQRAQAERNLAVAEQADRDHRGEGCRPRVDERIAQQDHTEQPVGLGKQGGRAPGAAVTLPDEMLQPVAVQRHHARFRNRKKCRYHEQHRKGAELPAERDCVHGSGVPRPCAG